MLLLLFSLLFLSFSVAFGAALVGVVVIVVGICLANTYRYCSVLFDVDPTHYQ